MTSLIQLTTGIVFVVQVITATSIAQAGEAKAAGSVSIKTDVNGNITHLSSSIAVGKNSAATTMLTTGTDTFSSAIAGGGTITLINPDQSDAAYTLSSDKNLGAVQINRLSGSTTIDPRTGGTVTIPD